MSHHARHVARRHFRRFAFVGLLAATTCSFGWAMMDTLRSPLSAAPTAQSTVLEEQSFEDPSFPPPGWESVDVFASQGGTNPQYTWGRETCDPAPGGGDAVAWSVRDGEAGAMLGCLDPYLSSVFTILRFGPIDTQSYPGGLEVNFLFKLQAPSVQSFTVCVVGEGVGEEYGCFGTGIDETDWATFPDPGMVFTDAGNRQSVWVEIRYSDILAQGGDYGALIDEVVIRGRGGSGGPTPTRFPSATAGPTRPPTLTPRPTGTQEATPSVTPSPTTTTPPTGVPTNSATLTPSSTPSDVPPSITPRASATATLTPIPGRTPSATPSRTTPTETTVATLVPPVGTPTQPAATTTTPDAPVTATSTTEVTSTPADPPTAGPTSEVPFDIVYLPFAVVPRSAE